MIAAYLLFGGLLAALIALPLIPAIREWRHPTDTTPLQVAQDSEVDIRHHANRFRAWIAAQLAEPMAACRRTGEPESGTVGADRFLVLPGGSPPLQGEGKGDGAQTQRVVAACGPLQVAPAVAVTKELYVAGTLTGGADCVYRAVLADGEVVLGPRSRTLRWVHALGAIRIGAGSRIHGRISSDRSILFEPGCGFERVWAPVVGFGADLASPPAPAPRQLPLADPIKLAGTRAEIAAGRCLVRGDFELPPNTRLEADLVVTGTCRIGEGAIVAASVKARRDLILDAGVTVTGALVGERDLHLGPGCRVQGPVIAERSLAIGPLVVIGAPERPTTVNGLDVVVESSALLHGTIWAHRVGSVATGPAQMTRAEVTA